MRRFKHEREATNHRLREPHITVVAVVGTLIDEFFLIRILTDDRDLGVFAELDAIGPRRVEVEALRGGLASR